MGSLVVCSSMAFSCLWITFHKSDNPVFRCTSLKRKSCWYGRPWFPDRGHSLSACRLLNNGVRQYVGVDVGWCKQKHLKNDIGLEAIGDFTNNFSVLKKCNGKLDSLIGEMLVIKKKRAWMNTQSDSIRAKLFISICHCLHAYFMFYCPARYILRWLNSFQYFQDWEFDGSLWPLYTCWTPTSWYQETALSSGNKLPLILWHNRLP